MTLEQYKIFGIVFCTLCILVIGGLHIYEERKWKRNQGRRKQKSSRNSRKNNEKDKGKGSKGEEGWSGSIWD